GLVTQCSRCYTALNVYTVRTCRNSLCSLALVILLAVGGCSPETDNVCPDPKLAAPIGQVIQYHNANANRIPRLWSYAKVALTFREKPSDLGVTWGSTSPLAETNARVFLTKQDEPQAPPNLILQIKEAGQEVGRVGISTHDNVYYMWLNLGEKRQVLYGQLDLAGCPTAGDIPIDPTQLPAALGIMPLSPDRTFQTYSTDPCAYVMGVTDRQPVTGRLLLKRDMYLDRRADVIRNKKGTLKDPRANWDVVDADGRGLRYRPPRLMLTDIYAPDGRLVLTARTSDYKPVELADVKDSGETPPVIPTDIHLTWHETGSEMHIGLSGMTTADKLVPEAYYFWDRLPAALRPLARRIDAPFGPARKKPTNQQ
ncbi:MAG: hypothetical protein KGY81_08585, partial [Phycisphaerae bacterium]|nr:hypothetical protein [Phycisphaerae bacterium]